MKFGERLKQARTLKNLTQEQVADRFFITRQTISSWENEKSYPDIDSLIKLSDFYHISLDTLIKEDSGMKEYLEKKTVMKSFKKLNLIFVLINAIFITLVILNFNNLIYLNRIGQSIFTVFGILISLATIQIAYSEMKFDKSTRHNYLKLGNIKFLIASIILIAVGLFISIGMGMFIGTVIGAFGLATIILYLIAKVSTLTK